jgi:hypothetical protein
MIFKIHLPSFPGQDQRHATELSPKATRLIARPVVALFLTAVTVSLGAGCSSTGAKRGEPVSNRYVVKSDLAPFYKQGPAQGYGPDTSLKEGSIVTMIKRGFGYSKVSDQVYGEGWMATSDLQPAPAEPELEPESTEDVSGSYRSSDSDNPAHANPEYPALPESEPTPLPDELRPAFRY